MSAEFRRIALLGKPDDPKVEDSIKRIAAHLEARGIEVLMEPEAALARLAGAPRLLDPETLVQEADLFVAVGGDGTMLHATRRVAHRGGPILGINRGRLGFLVDISPEDMLERLDEILTGRFEREERLLLRAQCAGAEDESSYGLALNDVVIQRGGTGRMLDIETWIGSRYVNTHGGDGLVVATATGSTAYALSCGGPIIQPDLDALVLAPICPHTLSDRPLVVRADVEIVVRVHARGGTVAQVSCDGRPLCELPPDTDLQIRAADRRVSLIHPEGYDYYRILRSKLHWGRASFARSGHEPD